MAAEPSPKRSRWAEGLGDGLYGFVDGLAMFGLWSGGAVAAAFGRFMLGGALAVLGLGVFLRFKRLRMKRKAKRA
ncbi:hypothetical protein [Roseateles sp. P5_E1]